ncbi:MAG: NAD(P)-binding protein [Gemmatimonadota bacterium]
MSEVKSPAVSGRERSAPRAAILGSGPVGLDAALAAVERGFRVRVYEAGETPAANVRSWEHVRLFSPWRMNVSPRMERALEEVGAELDVDPEDSPTGREFADHVLDPLWGAGPAAGTLHLSSRVVAVGREGVLKHEAIGSPERGRLPFRILLSDPAGREWIEHADVVFDCTGKYGNPNPMGESGIPAPGERRLLDKIVRRIPDLPREADAWSGRTTLLVGAGHSAQTAARDLAKLASAGDGTRVVWAVRDEEPDWGRVADDPLPLRRELAESSGRIEAGAFLGVELRRGVGVDRLEGSGGDVTVRLLSSTGDTEEIRVDRILALTGGVGDHSLYRQLQIHECYATSGPMKLSAALLGGGAGGDCLDQGTHGVETLTNPEPGFFILGDKSYGRNNTFLMRTGWGQVNEVFASLAS